MARLALVQLCGILYGCAPQGSASLEKALDGGLQGGGSSAARASELQTDGRATRADSGRTLQRPGAAQPGLNRRSAAQDADSSTQDVEWDDAEWTMTIQPDATVTIKHKGVRVLYSSHVTWAERTKQTPDGKWVGSRFQAEGVRRGQGTLSGAVRELDLQARGAIRRLADNEVRFDFQFRAAKGHSDIFGTTLVWVFDLNPPTFGAKASSPILLENNSGWMWPVGANDAITVRFDRPLEKVAFEGGTKNKIQTFFYADRIAAGTRNVGFTVRLPDGGRIAPAPEERYGSAEPNGWFRGALSWDESPIDLSFLNAQDRPAGRHGVLKADGDRLVFEDGTPARFWGGNLVAYALFRTPRENFRRQARRMAQLGFNLMRIHQHDADWCRPNIFLGGGRPDTRHFNLQSFDSIDWWIKCLEDEGIYVWLDMVYNRALAPGDDVTVGFDEIQRNHGYVWGWNYFNPDVRNLMQEFQHNYLNHVNRYTHRAYKDDPAIVGILITNENDLTLHHGNRFMPNHNNPTHTALYMKDARAFAGQNGLPADRVWRAWEPGPSKIFLGAMEHRFNRFMIDDLRSLGTRAPLATMNYWSGCALFSLPSLTDGDIIDVHSYGRSEELSKNPRYEASFLSEIGAAQVQGKPLSITEWSVPYPKTDRFTAPLYFASIAALQGWDMPMIFNYSQAIMKKDEGINEYSSYVDPALCGLMPAAAVAFRRGHISPARKNYCLILTPDQLFGSELSARTSVAIRTLLEQSRLTVGLPAVKELPWLKPTETPSDATIVTDPDHDYVPAGVSFVRSDTGELLHNWKYGIQTINTPKTQAVSGWIGGKTLELSDVLFRFSTPKAVVALTSLDEEPLSRSRTILITAMARAATKPQDHPPFFSEPTVGTIILRTRKSGLQLLALGPNGRVSERVEPQTSPEGLSIHLPTRRGTHWYVLKAVEPPKNQPDSEPKG
jgi:hypothetical protein